MPHIYKYGDQPDDFLFSYILHPGPWNPPKSKDRRRSPGFVSFEELHAFYKVPRPIEECEKFGEFWDIRLCPPGAINLLPLGEALPKSEWPRHRLELELSLMRRHTLFKRCLMSGLVIRKTDR